MVVAEMLVRCEPQMTEAAILVSGRQTAAAHHKGPAAVDPQRAAWSRLAEALPPQVGRQTVVAELLNMVAIEVLLRKGEAARRPQVVQRRGEAGMRRADL